MKNINELTENEILALTDEDISKMINYKKAEEGFKFMDYPICGKKHPITNPDKQVYNCILMGNNVSFTDIQELNKLVKLLQSFKTMCSINYSYQYLNNGDKYYIEDGIQTSEYNHDHWSKIESKAVYTNRSYTAIKDSLKLNNQIETKFKKELNDYNDNKDKSNWITNEVNDRVNEVKDKYYKLNNYCEMFKNDYLPLSDNDETIAMKFITKAYNLNLEEKTYILDNYKV